jgi:hypothetical protein
MTPEVPDAERIGRHGRTFKVQPQESVRVPGTPFVVWHCGNSDATATILSDGALDLDGARNWIVRTT